MEDAPRTPPMFMVSSWSWTDVIVAKLKPVGRTPDQVLKSNEIFPVEFGTIWERPMVLPVPLDPKFTVHAV
jgi:hypothetical protein